MKKTTIIITAFFLHLATLASAESLSPEDVGVSSFWSQCMIYLGLFLGSAAIILHYRSLGKLKSKFHRLEDNCRRFNETQQVDLNRLAPFLANKADRSELVALEEQLSFLNAQVKKLAQPLREFEWTGFTKKSMELESQTGKITGAAESLQPETERFYAKFADLDNGFSPAVLQRAQNGEQVFEIIAAGDTATFHISDDINAQKYALAESTFTLGKACELVNQPFKGCQIIMDQEGTLAKVSGNWLFGNKAKITFR